MGVRMTTIDLAGILRVIPILYITNVQVICGAYACLYINAYTGNGIHCSKLDSISVNLNLLFWKVTHFISSLSLA